MDFEEGKEGDVVVLEPKGGFNTQASSALLRKLAALVGDGQPKVVIDFRSVDKMTATAARALLATNRRVTAPGGLIVLCGLNDEVRKVFSNLGVEGELRIVEERRDAVPLAAKAGSTNATTVRRRIGTGPAAPTGSDLGARLSVALSRGDSRPCPWDSWTGQADDPGLAALQERLRVALARPL